MSKILIVDDDECCREVLHNYLSLRGYDIIEASNADEALEILDESIDLIITDLVMPEVSGDQLIEKVRKRSSVKIIAMSGYGIFSPNPVENSTKLEIDGSFRKNDKIEVLADMIEDLLSKS